MPCYTGKFQYQRTSGGTAQEVACRLAFEQDMLTLVPDSGEPLTLDLGDIDVFSPTDYELSLTVYTGDSAAAVRQSLSESRSRAVGSLSGPAFCGVCC
jgi:hypothetical protein